MNGERARKLRHMAVLICQDVLKLEDLDDGYNVYNQARNCRGWAPATDSKGEVMYDGDGMALKQLVNTLPGTITCAQRLRAVYKQLKKQFREGKRGGKRRQRLDGARAVQSSVPDHGIV
ncbi:unnamed protein product [marine sediment metagenome]|uniref:Uncharacterized protein n=1 Tax=marine sediment metagenome TaxID=412755 RepID=X0T339_9ZZZZ